MIAGGWQLSGVLSIYSGQPFTATASTSSLNSQASSQFADCPVAPAEKLSNIFQWYNKADFGVPASGRFGTCGPDSLIGPGLANVDMGLDRKFRLTERFELRFGLNRSISPGGYPLDSGRAGQDTMPCA
jgi:hypothetical protein